MTDGRIASSVLRRVRDGWVIVGAVAMLALVFEVGYRIQGSARHLMFGGQGSSYDVSLDATPPWWDSLLAEQGEIDRTVEWLPYVYHVHHGFEGSYMSVDASGVRRTVQATGGHWPATRSVFFFGGSTMWGEYQRDEFTIPSLAAAALSDAGFDGVTVVNYGEHAYGLGLEVDRLVSLLRHGERPSVVVFYDGIDDVFSAIQNGESGDPVEMGRYELSRRIYNQEHSLEAELGAGAAIASGLKERLLLVTRLSSLFADPKETRAYRPAHETAPLLSRDYWESVRVVQALATAYGFEPVFVWQPTIYRSKKPLTPAESRIRSVIAEDPFQAYLNELHPLVAKELSSGVDSASSARFVDLTGLFNHESEQIYIDVSGHTTERANGIIVDRLKPHLIGALESSAVAAHRQARDIAPATSRLGNAF